MNIAKKKAPKGYRKLRVGEMIRATDYVWWGTIKSMMPMEYSAGPVRPYHDATGKWPHHYYLRKLSRTK